MNSSVSSASSVSELLLSLAVLASWRFIYSRETRNGFSRLLNRDPVLSVSPRFKKTVTRDQ